MAAGRCVDRRGGCTLAGAADVELLLSGCKHLLKYKRAPLDLGGDGRGIGVKFDQQGMNTLPTYNQVNKMKNKG